MSGAMIAAATAASAGANLLGASKSSKAATKAANQQQAMQQAQLDFQKQQYNRYLGLFGPTEEQLAAQSRSNQPLFYDQNKAQIQQQYANALRNQATQMGRLLDRPVRFLTLIHKASRTA
jgi:membrane-anchored protein YejM (alkaline phosphatase superfamily)